MRKLRLGASFLLPSSLAIAQAAAEVPIEPTVGAGALVTFGLVVLVMIVGFLVVMSKKAKKDKESEAAGGSLCKARADQVRAFSFPGCVHLTGGQLPSDSRMQGRMYRVWGLTLSTGRRLPMRAILSSVFLFLMSFGAFAVEEANKDAEIAHTGSGAVIVFGVFVLIFCGWVVWAIKRASKKQAEEDAAKK